MSCQAQVTVIIPAYNMAEYLGAAIESVLSGDYDNVEVICINDGSTDATERVVRQYTDPQSGQYDERVRYFSQSNRGKSVAVNYGISQMQGKYFTILDADDCLPPQSLKQRVEALSSNPDAGIAIGGFEVISETETTSVGERSCPTLQNPRYLKHIFCLSYKTPFHLNACLLRRNIVESVGMLDCKLKRCQDIDYSIRCMDEVQKIVRVDASVYRYRKHRKSTWERITTRVATIKHRPRVVLKNFSPPEKYLYVVIVAVFGFSKIVYELFGMYEN